MARLGTELGRHLVPISCPACTYEFEIQLIDVIAQVTRTCPCCRCRIRLVDAEDAEGELRSVDHVVQDAFDDLSRAFGGGI